MAIQKSGLSILHCTYPKVHDCGTLVLWCKTAKFYAKLLKFFKQNPLCDVVVIFYRVWSYCKYHNIPYENEDFWEVWQLGMIETDQDIYWSIKIDQSFVKYSYTWKVIPP